MRYTAEKNSTIYLGKQGEHLARELVFPELTLWEKEYGPGEAEIIFLPPGGKEPVTIAPARTEDGAGLWAVTASETACQGYGKCELRYSAGDAVTKSSTYQTYVAGSLGNPGEKPAEMPLLTDAESGISYALIVEGGRLMIQEAE